MRARALAGLLVLAVLVGWAGPPGHSDEAGGSASLRTTSAALAQGVVKPSTASRSTSARGLVDLGTLTPVPGISGGVRPPDCDVKRCVALTYDDGPGLPTPRLLDILARRHAPATFFLVGEMIKYRPATALRTARAGHEIGVHTWDHSDLTTLSDRQVESQLKRTLDIIRRVTGVRPTIMRPPYGATNRRVRRIAGSLGLAEILWDVDTADWRDRNASLVASRAIRGAHRNSIILMHDIRPTTVDAAGRIIHGLRARGFTLVTVTELLGGTRAGVSYYRPNARHVIR
jgi:peptidoglycan-N-acetylglucosamine deacetylase